jgi:hypothetical protein
VLAAERRLGDKAMAIKAAVDQVSTPFKSVTMIQAHVKERQPEKPMPSASLTKEIMKKCLHLSYVKLSLRTTKVLSREHLERKRDVAKVLLGLDALSYDIVAVDEFSVDTRLTRPYAWCQKGSVQYLVTEHRGNAWSGILAMTKKGLVHVMVQRGTVNAEVFVAYLKEVLSHLRQQGYAAQKAIFFADNAASHGANLTKDYLAQHKLRLLLNAPECPEHNPVEHAILMTKMRLRDKILKFR